MNGQNGRWFNMPADWRACANHLGAQRGRHFLCPCFFRSASMGRAGERLQRNGDGFDRRLHESIVEHRTVLLGRMPAGGSLDQAQPQRLHKISAARVSVPSSLAKQKRNKRVDGGSAQNTEIGIDAILCSRVSRAARSTSFSSLIAL
jgi:hypothetical protein